MSSFLYKYFFIQVIGLYLLTLRRIRNKIPMLRKYVRVAQLDRAFDYGSKGREFESSRARS